MLDASVAVAARLLSFIQMYKIVEFSSFVFPFHLVDGVFYFLHQLSTISFSWRSFLFHLFYLIDLYSLKCAAAHHKNNERFWNFPFYCWENELQMNVGRMFDHKRYTNLMRSIPIDNKLTNIKLRAIVRTHKSNKCLHKTAFNSCNEIWFVRSSLFDGHQYVRRAIATQYINLKSSISHVHEYLGVLRNSVQQHDTNNWHRRILLWWTTSSPERWGAVFIESSILLPHFAAVKNGMMPLSHSTTINIQFKAVVIWLFRYVSVDTNHCQTMNVDLGK